jgi:hypothetical protein
VVSDADLRALRDDMQRVTERFDQLEAELPESRLLNCQYHSAGGFLHFALVHLVNAAKDGVELSPT